MDRINVSDLRRSRLPNEAQECQIGRDNLGARQTPGETVADFVVVFLSTVFYELSKRSRKIFVLNEEFCASAQPANRPIRGKVVNILQASPG